MKLVFVIKSMSLASGGAERVLADLTSALVKRGHDITLVTNDGPETDDFYQVSREVHRQRLAIGDPARPSGFREIARRIAALRKLIKELNPEVAVGFMHSSYIPLAFALRGTGVPVVASEHIDYNYWRTYRAQFALIRASVPLFAAMTILSDAVKCDYPRDVSRKMTPIPNPVSSALTQNSYNGPAGARKRILSIGRLTQQKDQRTLISAFEIVAARHPDWDVRIIGEGELRGALERQIASLSLAGRIALPGTTRAIDKEYQYAQLYAHPAIHESFGLVTAEALAHGLPAVGFADCPGTNELIIDGRNGVLVSGTDRVAALAAALDLLMSSAEMRQALGQQGPDSVARFSIDAITDRWEDLLALVARGHAPPGKE